MDKRGRKIAEGGGAEVYEWGGADRIVKLAKRTIDDEMIRLEFENTMNVWKHGIRSARPYELVMIEEKPGIIFERIHGNTLMRHWTEHSMGAYESASVNDDMLQMMVETLHKIHQRSDISMMVKQRVCVSL